MKKVPTLFKRNPEDMRHLLPEVTPGCEWVLEGEGTPTQKYDGTCVMVDEKGEWWARREIKPGKQAPPNFRLVETDENTGKSVGWEPIYASPFMKFHEEAVTSSYNKEFPPGTYELCGPKINKNPQGYPIHTLIRHSLAAHIVVPRDFEGLREVLTSPAFEGIEGVVWHHSDGRMAKIKVRDFT